MDETVPLQFPYPQCDPPLTKDAADIQQLQSLALDVDTAAQALWTEADNVLISPDACVMGRTSTLVNPVSGGFIDWQTTLYDNTGGALPDLAGNQVLIRQQGYYLLWCSFQVDLSPSGRAFVDFAINGVLAGRTGYGASVLFTAVAAQKVVLLNSGDTVSYAFTTTTAATQMTFARAGALRLV